MRCYLQPRITSKLFPLSSPCLFLCPPSSSSGHLLCKDKFLSPHVSPELTKCLLHQASPHWRTCVSTPRSTMVRSGRTAPEASAAQRLVACSSATCAASTVRRPPSSRGIWAPIRTTRLPRAPSPLMWLRAALFPLATWWQHLPCTSLVTRWWTCWSQTALVSQHPSPTVSSGELSNNNLSFVICPFIGMFRIKGGGD